MRSEKLYKIREEAIKHLEKLAEELDATIYLFGSYAQATHTMQSDIDIIVVSEKYANTPHPQRVEQTRLKLPKNLAFDIIPLTPQEFQQKKNKPLFREASKHWVKITPKRKN